MSLGPGPAALLPENCLPDLSTVLHRGLHDFSTADNTGLRHLLAGLWRCPVGAADMLPLFSEPQLDDDEDEDTSENTDPRLLKLENAFLCAAIDMDDPITDLETAWTLATTRGFLDAVQDDGTGMPEAIEKLVDRYPYLADVGDDDEPPPRTGPNNTGRTPSPPTSRVAAVAGQQALAERFPALRRKVRKR